MNNALGSVYAGRYWERAKTLAEGIPAMSFAAGSNPIQKFGIGRNIDIMTLQTGWPEVRPKLNPADENDNRRRWFHSDAKDVAFFFNYSLYQSWVDEGDLK